MLKAKEKEKIAVIDNKLKVCEEKIYADPYIVLEKSEEALALSKEIEDYARIAKSLYYQGMAKYYTGDFIEARKVFARGLRISGSKIVMKKDIVELHKGMALIYAALDQLEKALQHYFVAIEISKEIKYYKGLCRIYNNIGLIYSILGENETCIAYLLKAEAVEKEVKDNNIKTLINLNIASAYADQKKYTEAEEALNIAKELATKYKMSISLISIENTMGKIYKGRKEYEKAEKTLKNAHEMAIKENNDFYNLDNYKELALLYNETKEWQKGRIILKGIIETSKRLGKKKELNNALYGLGRCLQDKGEHIESYKYYKESIEINDEIEKEQKLERLRFAEEQMVVSEVNKENQELQSINKNLKEISLICKSITSQYQLNLILKKVYSNLEKLVPKCEYQVFLYEKERNKLVGYTMENEILQEKAFYNELNKWMMSKKKTYDINNLSKESIDYIKEVTGKRQDAVSFLYIPLIAENDLIGTICIFDYEGTHYDKNTIEIIEILSSYIAVAINNAQNIKKIEKTNKILEKASKIDPLTQIANRRYFNMFTNERWEDYIEKQENISVMIIDIDHFKKYNDTCGHIEGDKALKKVADTLRENIIKGEDFLARFGGEEFIIFNVGKDKNEIIKYAEEVRQAIEKIETTCVIDEMLRKLTVSIGISTLTAEIGLRIETLTNNADEALYKAKEKGRNRVEVYENGCEQNEK